MKFVLYILIYYSLLFTQSFTIEQNFGQINIDDFIYERPFLGGFNKPKIQWIDWDQDGNQDLFILDEDGHIQYYYNDTSFGVSDFILLDTNFLNISNISWFFIS